MGSELLLKSDKSRAAASIIGPIAMFGYFFVVLHGRGVTPRDYLFLISSGAVNLSNIIAAIVLFMMVVVRYWPSAFQTLANGPALAEIRGADLYITGVTHSTDKLSKVVYFGGISPRYSWIFSDGTRRYVYAIWTKPSVHELERQIKNLSVQFEKR